MAKAFKKEKYRISNRVRVLELELQKIKSVLFDLIHSSTYPEAVEAIGEFVQEKNNFQDHEIIGFKV